MTRVACAGILVADLIAVDLPGVSRPGEITFVPKGIQMHAGGHAANVSIDLMGLGFRPGEVSCLGAVGRDLCGAHIGKTLARHRVAAHLQQTNRARTSIDLILVVKDQDRRYHADVGANALLEPSFVLRSVKRSRPAVFYLGGAGLLARLDASLTRVMKEAKDCGCLTFVDPVMPYGKSWDFLRKAMKWMDIFHCNDKEAQSLTGRARPAEALEALRRQGIKLALITKGREGVVAASGPRFVSMKAFRVKTLDPTGAGDAFCAGIIHRLARRFPPAGSPDFVWTDQEMAGILLEAQAAGAACVTGVGTTSAVRRKNVRALLTSQGASLLRSAVFQSFR
jgi:sugar/nucleoside kinase (ribokinase family)